MRRPNRRDWCEHAKFELGMRKDLYKFYGGAYLRTVAFFLAITALLLKLALDDPDRRTLLSLVGIGATLIALIPLINSFIHYEEMRDRFDELARETRTKAVSVTPILLLALTSSAFWFLVAVGWFVVLTDAPKSGG